MLRSHQFFFLSILLIYICNGSPITSNKIYLNKRNGISKSFNSNSGYDETLSLLQKRQLVTTTTTTRPTLIQNGIPISQTGIPITQTGIPITQTGIPINQNPIPIISNPSILSTTPMITNPSNLNNQGLLISSGSQLGGVPSVGLPPFNNGGRGRNVGGGNGRPSGLV
ncbi:hypothetical protein DFH28DRAFT_936292 [Melampsora americana]|nr:hypothetical protein DFH28DRAFT_936292 [Melampsora americana]